MMTELPRYSKIELEKLKYGADFKHFIKGRQDLNWHMIKRLKKLVQDIWSEETPWN